MSDALPFGHAAVFENLFAHHAARPQVEHHRRAGVIFQVVTREQSGQQIAGDHLGVLVDKDAAIGVAVEARAKVCPVFAHSGL